MKMFKPLNQFVIVRMDRETERKTDSGLILAGSVQSNLVTATVLEVSDGVHIEGTESMRAPCVSPGDRAVLITREAGLAPGLALNPAQPEIRMVDEAEIVGLVTDEG